MLVYFLLCKSTLTLVQNIMRMREQQHNQLLRQQPMMPGQMNPMNMRPRNGMVPPNLQKTVLQNNSLYVFDICLSSLVLMIVLQISAADSAVAEEPTDADDAAPDATGSV